jgi:murein DD-endopeptidase MepM/ murein hydrolase activator NlpD
MSTGEERSSLAREVAAELGRCTADQAARKLAGSLLAKAGVVGRAKVLAQVGVVLLVIMLIVVLVAAIGAAFQQSMAPWPVRPIVRADGTYASGGWSISSRFGWRDNPVTEQAEFHDGIDIVNPGGSCPFGFRCELPAMLDGVVTYVGWDEGGGSDPSSTGGGQIVIMQNGNADHEVLYAHLEPYRLHVQLQGRIEDAFGRYDEYRDYQPIGTGELMPDLSDGEIAMWCAGDMPRFRPTRTGAGTVTFEYDRPAECRTAITWGKRGQDWEGWVADEPSANQDGQASLSWQTPIEQGVRAGDVALRFRAHLVPPPPPPTATPTPAVVLPDELNAPQAISAYRQDQYGSDDERRSLTSGLGAPAPKSDSTGEETALTSVPQSCEQLANGTRCTWSLAAIPTSAERDAETSHKLAAVPANGTGSAGGARHVSVSALTPTPTSTVFAQAPRADPATPTTLPGPMLVSTASRYLVPVGGRFSVTTSVWSTRASTDPIPVRIRSDDGGLLVREARATRGSCSSSVDAANCAVTAQPGAPATITIVFEVLPVSAGMRYVTITSTTAGSEREARDQLLVEVARYAVTPEPWPPATVQPAPPASPLPTLEPIWPTTAPGAPPRPTIAPPELPPGRGPGGSPVDCAAQMLIPLPDVVNAHGRTDNTRLIAPAAAAYQAVRQEIRVRTGQDPLARLADGLRAPEFRSTKPGVARQSWHMTGRAIDLDTGYPWRRVREGRMWRLFAGSVDVTVIFERHGFNRIPDRDDSTEWWHYEYRPDGLTWASAMLQIYPLARLQAAFPEVAWTAVGCQIGADVPISGSLPEAHDQCTVGSPSFGAAVEEMPGCGPPVRAGDRVYQLDSVLGFVGLTGQTTGPHLHLGLKVQSYDGVYHQLDVCTLEWLQGREAPPDGNCWTEMADPLSFLPLAPPPQLHVSKAAPGQTATAVLPEGAPYQLPPPGYPGSLFREVASGDAPTGQYWSPYQDGGQYGGGDVLAWIRDSSCQTWDGFPWCGQ